MKLRKTISIVAALMIGETAVAQTYQSTTDVIYGQRCFVEVGGKHYDTGVREGTGSFYWPSRNDAQVCYYLHVPEGYICMSAFVSTKTSAPLRLRVTDPDDNKMIVENEMTTSGGSSNAELQLIKDVKFPADKWYRFEFTSSKPSSINAIIKLEFKRESPNEIVTSLRFMAASTHLWARYPNDPLGPTGECFDWSYQEVRYPSQYLRVATYLETMGLMGGYMGIQYDGPFNGDKNYKVIFSMWDKGDVDTNPNLPEYLRSGNMDSDPNISINRFGGEKTGIQAMYTEGKWWEPDKWVQFLFNTRPEQTTVTEKDQNGNDSTFVFENSIVTAWYKMEDDPDWTYLATHRVAGRPYLFSSFYSFLENYGECGEIYTRGYWRKGYMRSAASGKWYSVSGYSFTNNDGGSARTARHDYGHGATEAFTNAFYMEHGAFTSTVNDSAQFVGAPLDQSCVDTIDIDSKIARINQAIKKDAARQADLRLKSTGETYDLTKWELIGFSDQEENDGANGFAKQAIDGDRKTFWRNKWRNGGLMYPHWIALKAPSRASISEISVYTDKKSYLYWPAKAVIYTSEDGSNWTLASDTVEFERAAESTAVLTSRVNSQYFKIEFTEGFGAMMNINELTLSTNVSPSKIYDYAKQLLDNANCFDSYPAEDLVELRKAYNDGNGDIDEIANVINKINQTSTPLKYGHVSGKYYINSLHRYQLSSHNGYGKLAATTDGHLTVGQATISGSLDEYKKNVDVTQLRNNWMIIQAEGYKKYYLYNPGLRKYFDSEAENFLSDTPSEVDVSYMIRDNAVLISSKKKYITLDPTDAQHPVKTVSVGNQGSYFDLYDNYYLIPSDAEAKYVIGKCVDYAKFDSYVAKLRDILNVSEGLVGSVPAGQERDRLTALYNNGNISIDNRALLYKAVDSCQRIPFDPTKYVYRVKSMSSNKSNTPILTANNSPSTEFKAQTDNDVTQIWSFAAYGEALSPTSQDVSLGRLGRNAGNEITQARSKTKQAGRYYVSEDNPGVFSISSTQYGGMALSSLYANTTAYYGNSNAQFQMQLIDNIKLTLNSAGMKGVNYAFDIIVPEDLKVYVVDHLDGNTACFLRVYDRLPAGTPALICGEANQQLDLEIAAPSGKSIEDNMLHGTYFAASGLKGTIYTLSTNEGGCFSKALIGNVPANSVYLELGDDAPTGNIIFDFSDEPTGIENSKQRIEDNAQHPMINDKSTYDLQGRKIERPFTGLYIHNGKVIKK